MDISYKTVARAIEILANECAGKESMIIDILTGYLWDDEEANILKGEVHNEQ